MCVTMILVIADLPEIRSDQDRELPCVPTKRRIGERVWGLTVFRRFRLEISFSQLVIGDTVSEPVLQPVFTGGTRPIVQQETGGQVRERVYTRAEIRQLARQAADDCERRYGSRFYPSEGTLYA